MATLGINALLQTLREVVHSSINDFLRYSVPCLNQTFLQRFSLWSILENEACSKPHQSIEALKKSLVKAWNAMPQEIIDRAVDDFPKRLKKVH